MLYSWQLVELSLPFHLGPMDWTRVDLEEALLSNKLFHLPLNFIFYLMSGRNVSYKAED